MRADRRLLIAGVLLAAACTGLFAYGEIIDPRELTRPIAITDVRALADGGSMALQVLGANGKKLTLERVGSLDVERSLQPMYVVNTMLWVFPLRRAAGKNSELEKETREMLESWLKDSLPMTQRELLKQSDPSTLRTVPGNVLAAYDLATWIVERR